MILSQSSVLFPTHLPNHPLCRLASLVCMRPSLDGQCRSLEVSGVLHAPRLPSTCVPLPHNPPRWCIRREFREYQNRGRCWDPSDHCDRRGRRVHLRGHHVHLRGHHGPHGHLRPPQQRAQRRYQMSP